ncbi:AMP-binding protein [Bradyrhizobium sp. LHD-71]|uniref:AMP-binding protein n=1 Tax=Bradyrhizobium sp. LHD-71 TaxID=3072141 RepID=UPI00280EE8A1|nr:AMP-binding protein [Bradyrhizobium sp. LHD-71]MDQ8727485.1 AMP-binding protein [Bradyrhizobium sp. LHD-71]
MIEIDDSTTIGEAFAAAQQAYGARPFLAVPKGAHRPYHQNGYEISFAQAGREVSALVARYRSAGFGPGHRVAVLLDNRPEYFLHKLALNSLGVSAVPINPDYRANEIAYLLEHSEPVLALAAPERREQLEAGMNVSAHRPPIVVFDDGSALPPARTSAGNRPITAESEASILYTSGTTGRPKGCMLSHGYELASGAWYANGGGLATFRPEGDRIYNPLPVYHCNSAVVSFYGAMLNGSCQIQPDRFHPNRWWSEVKETAATVVHYLGVIVPLLLGRLAGEEERGHAVRFAIGAGVEPQLHATFEQRFGFPLIEVWGMTEMVRLLFDNQPPRQVGTRAFGRPVPGIEVRVVDENDNDVPRGVPGEMVLRHSVETPRRGFYSGYLKDEAATAHAWRGNWFHTGDTVQQDPDGMLHFVDRKKNIIRRSGENIAAAEVEATLQAHAAVKQVAVLAVPDETREEEVLACVVLHDDREREAKADVLFRHCYAQLAYFKAPGWIYFTDTLPTTGTQKIQKHQIFPGGADPRALSGMFDLRARKTRTERKDT